MFHKNMNGSNRSVCATSSTPLPGQTKDVSAVSRPTRTTVRFATLTLMSATVTRALTHSFASTRQTTTRSLSASTCASDPRHRRRRRPHRRRLHVPQDSWSLTRHGCHPTFLLITDAITTSTSAKNTAIDAVPTARASSPIVKMQCLSMRSNANATKGG